MTWTAWSGCCGRRSSRSIRRRALSDRMERSLSSVTEAAAEELSDWELSAMRDPRNWVPTAAAIVVGTAAAGGLVLVRTRQQHRRRQATGIRALERSVRGVAGDIEKRLRR